WFPWVAGAGCGAAAGLGLAADWASTRLPDFLMQHKLDNDPAFAGLACGVVAYLVLAGAGWQALRRARLSSRPILFLTLFAWALLFGLGMLGFDAAELSLAYDLPSLGSVRGWMLVGFAALVLAVVGYGLVQLDDVPWV